MKKKISSGLLCLSSVVLVALLAACSTAAKTTASDLKKGDRVILRISLGLNGKTEVKGADVEADDDNDGDQNECEDGLTADGKWCDGGPAANKDDGKEDGNGKEEDDDAQMVVGPAIISGDSVKVLWLAVRSPASARLAPGSAMRFSGSYLGKANFAAAKVEATTKPTPRVMGRLDGVVSLPGGKLGLQIFGQMLEVNPRLRLRNVSSLADTVKQDKDGDTEQDGVICEQQGEHEGNNQGC